MSKVSKIRHRVYLSPAIYHFLGILLLAILILYPIFATPLGTDDIWMSTLRGYNLFHHTDSLHYLLEKSRQFHDIGRLAQISNTIQMLTGYFIYHRLVYKFYLLILTLSLVIFIRYFVLAILGKEYASTANVTAFSLICFSEIRNYYDPRTQMAGIFQISTILILFSVACWVNIKNRSHMEWKLLLFIFACIANFYLYEMSFFILFPFLLFCLYDTYHSKNLSSRFKRERNWKIIGLTLIFSQYIVLFWTHFSSHNRQPDSELSFTFNKVSKTFFLQLFGSFPAKVFAGQNVYKLNYVPNIIIIAFTAVTFYIFYTHIRLYSKITKSGKNDLHNLQSVFFHSGWLPATLVSLSLILVPTLVTSCTVRFQSEIQPGLPYMSSFYEQTGIALFVGIASFAIRGRKRFKMYEYLILTFALYFAIISLVVNYTVTNPKFPLANVPSQSQNIFGWQREMVEKSAVAGAFNALGSNVNFDFTPQYAWTTTEYLTFLAKRRIKVIDSPNWWNNDDKQPKFDCNELDCNLEYLVGVSAKSYRDGLITMSRFKDLNSLDGAQASSKLVLIIAGKNLQNNPSELLSKICVKSAGKNSKSLNLLSTGVTTLLNPSKFKGAIAMLQLTLSSQIPISKISLCK
jgi:hypothetical protein